MSVEQMILEQAGMVPLSEVCQWFGLSFRNAARQASEQRFPLPAFRVGETWFVSAEQLAALAERKAEEARIAFERREVKEHAHAVDAPQPEARLMPNLPQASVYVPGEALFCAVYFLMVGDECIYVGRSINYPARIYTHSKGWEFDHALILDVPKERLDEVEAAFIRAMRPRRNGVIPSPPAHTRDQNGAPVPERVSEHDQAIIREFMPTAEVRYRV